MLNAAARDETEGVTERSAGVRWARSSSAVLQTRVLAKFELTEKVTTQEKRESQEEATTCKARHSRGCHEIVVQRLCHEEGQGRERRGETHKQTLKQKAEVGNTGNEPKEKRGRSNTARRGGGWVEKAGR